MTFAVSEETPLRVVTYWWHDPKAKHAGNYSYTADHVRRLHNMWARNTSYPFTFHVVTDMPGVFEGDPDIDVIPIARWVSVIERFHRCYVKLGVFSWYFREYFGPCKVLTLDLDVVITGNTDHIVKKGLGTTFLGCKASESAHGQTRVYGGNLHMHDAGEHRNIWDAFRLVWKLASDGSEMTGSDQVWLTTVLGENRYPSVWNEDGVYDLKSLELEGKANLPDNACIVLVSGFERDVSQPELQEQYPWVKEHWA